MLDLTGIVSALGTRLTKYLRIYHKIISSLTYDRLTIVTYSVTKFLLGS